MSLKRAALLQKKRQYADGGSEGDYGDGPDVGGYAGSGPGAGGIAPGDVASGLQAGVAGTGKPGEDLMSQAAAMQQAGSYSPVSGMSPEDIQASIDAGRAAAAATSTAPSATDAFLSGLQSLGKTIMGGPRGIAMDMMKDFQAANARNVPAGGFPEEPGTHNQHEIPGGAETAQNPFGGAGTPAQTTPAAPVAPGSAGPRQYVWDPVTRQYTLANVGGGGNPMGYNQGQVFQMASGGAVGLAAGAPAQARFMRGGGTGLSDSIPVQMDDGGQGRLGDGEFVIPADVVSGLGGGSSEAGAKMLYTMMERIRQQAHGHAKQVNPVNPQQVLPV